MPNWCITDVCFSGKKENIERLNNDISKTMNWNRGNWYLNLPYFFLLNGFDVQSYTDSKDNGMLRNNNFRGTITYTNWMDCYDDDISRISVNLETAWWFDPTVLDIISQIYDVKYSSYSEEPNMDIFHTCHNTDDKYYDYDTLVRADYEQLEEEYEKDPTFDIYYYQVGNQYDREITFSIEELEERNIKYEIEAIPDISNDPRYMHGVYYETTPRGVIYPGVTYDNE